MKLVSRHLLGGITAVAAAAAMMVPGAAMAAGGPPPGHGGGHGQGQGGGRGNGGGGGPGEETAANNLSVPAIFVPSAAAENAPGLNFPCGAAEDPSGTPGTGFPVDPTAFYYLQGIDKWQASCAEEDTASVTATWGDNLTGEAALKTGSPIRVEVGLLANNASELGMTGYDVVKLEPLELDRVAQYGTAAESGAVDALPAAKATPYRSPPTTGQAEVRVWDAGATLKIYNVDTPDSPVFSGAATAEINSTGRVVYGYNLRVPTAGQYTIEFTAPTVSITSADPGSVSLDGHTISLTIDVVPGGGGGGGGPGGH